MIYVVNFLIKSQYSGLNVANNNSSFIVYPVANKKMLATISNEIKERGSAVCDTSTRTS